MKKSFKIDYKPIYTLTIGGILTSLLVWGAYENTKENAIKNFQNETMSNYSSFKSEIKELNTLATYTKEHFAELIESSKSYGALPSPGLKASAARLMIEHPHVVSVDVVKLDLKNRSFNSSQLKLEDATYSHFFNQQLISQIYEALHANPSKASQLFISSALGVKSAKSGKENYHVMLMSPLDFKTGHEEVVSFTVLKVNLSTMVTSIIKQDGWGNLQDYAVILNDSLHAPVTLAGNSHHSSYYATYVTDIPLAMDTNNAAASPRQLHLERRLTSLQEYANPYYPWMMGLAGSAVTVLITVMLCIHRQRLREANKKRSITQQEVLLKQLYGESERLNNIIEVQSSIVQENVSTEEFMCIAAQKILAFTKAQGAMIEVDEGEYTKVVAVVGSAIPFKGMLISKHDSISGLCLESKTAQVCTDAFNDMRINRQAVQQMNVRSIFAVPLLYPGGAIGVLKIISSQPAIFSEQDIQTLRLLSHVVGSALGQRLNYDAKSELLQQLQSTANALFKEKEWAQVTLKAIGDGVIATDINAKVTYLNPVAEQLTGWTNEDAQGHSIVDVFHIVNEITGHMVPNPILQALEQKNIVDMEPGTILVHTNGVSCAVDDSAAPIFDADGNTIGAVLVFRDVSHERKLSNEISHRAKHDTLTGLLNRTEFNVKIHEALQKHHETKHGCVLLYLDLDQFKIVNDTCGHQAGDELLVQVSHMLKSQVRNTDIVARLGGDEFSILLQDCHMADAYKIAEKIREDIKNLRFQWDGQIFTIGVSIGLADFSCDDFDMKRLISAADSACYIAKEKGRNQVCIYKPDAEEHTKRANQVGWAVRLQKALEDNRLVLFAQPIVGVKPQNKDFIHYEMLLRLRDEQGQLVPPMAFIPSAERYKMMPSLDRWVVRESLKFSKKHQHAMCSINLSGQSMSDDKFLDFVVKELNLQQANCRSICFEITETAAIANLKLATTFIHELKKLGCQFALDDFGSGMSSFNYLKQLCVDFLKIDGGFVKNMAHNPIDQAMVESINNIGHIMGLRTIAEFVENDDILQKLKLLGVDYAQGYGIGKPVSIDTIMVQHQPNSTDDTDLNHQA